MLSLRSITVPLIAIVLANFSLISLSLANTSVALVIGNSDYRNSYVKNASSEASELADALTEFGFKIHYGENLNSYDFENLIERFKRDASSANMALVYYNGHAIHLDNSNYLVPTNVVLKTRHDRPDLINLQSILDAVKSSKAALVILESCRESTMARGWGDELNRGYLCDSKTISNSNLAGNTQLAISTQNAKNTVQESYANTMSKLLREDTSWHDVVKATHKLINEKSEGKQQPVVMGALPKKYTLQRGSGSIVAEDKSSINSNPVDCAEPATGPEIDQAWDFVKSEKKIKAIDIFLEKYPCSIHTSDAENLKATISNQEQKKTETKPEKEPRKEPEKEPVKNTSKEKKLKDKLALTVNTSPPNASIRILTIKEKYRDGIILDRDQPYEVEVSAEGYKTVNKWITLDESTQNLTVRLSAGNSTTETGRAGFTFESTKALVDEKGDWLLRTAITSETAISTVHLYYRQKGTSHFIQVKLKSDKPNIYTHRIRKAIDPEQIEFVLRAIDTNGDSVSNGSSRNPLKTDTYETAKASNVAKTNSEKIRKFQTREDCKKSSIFRRIPVQSYVTNRAFKQNGKTVPESISKTVNLNDGTFHIYNKWKRSPVGDFKVQGYIYDGDDKLVSSGNWNFSTDGRPWNTWVDYQPKPTDSEGDWIAITCHNKRLHAVVKFRAVRK